MPYIGWDNREYEDPEMDAREQRRARPHTVTRGLPIAKGKDYQRLKRLVREYQHMQQWHGYQSRRLIESQCESLHQRVYGEFVYYGALPPEVYAFNSMYM